MVKYILGATDQAVRGLGSGAAPGAEQMATLPGFRAEASPRVALVRAVRLRELLAVLRALAPAPSLQYFIVN